MSGSLSRFIENGVYEMVSGITGSSLLSKGRKRVKKRTRNAQNWHEANRTSELSVLVESKTSVLVQLPRITIKYIFERGLCICWSGVGWTPLRQSGALAFHRNAPKTQKLVKVSNENLRNWHEANSARVGPMILIPKPASPYSCPE